MIHLFVFVCVCVCVYVCVFGCVFVGAIYATFLVSFQDFRSAWTEIPQVGSTNPVLERFHRTHFLKETL